MVSKKVQESREQLYVIGMIILLVICSLSLILIIIIAWNKPVILIEYKNQSCEMNTWTREYEYKPSFDANGNGPFQEEGMVCFTTPSEPKCDYILLKNGTRISKGSCITTYNYVINCINKSEIQEAHGNM